MPVIALIGAQAFAVSQLGMWLGESVSERACEGAERLVGAALGALAIVLLAVRLVH